MGNQRDNVTAAQMDVQTVQTWDPDLTDNWVSTTVAARVRDRLRFVPSEDRFYLWGRTDRAALKGF
jgi:hypothetical protein